MTAIPRNWLIFAVLIHIVAAWYSVGHYHDDEYHQILAFTASKIGLVDSAELRWEYESQLRSGFQPYIAFLIKQPLSFLGVDSPFLHAFILRLLSALISLIALVSLYKVLVPEINNENIRRTGLYYFLFLWLQVFLNVRFSSEGWAASLFILGFALYLSKENRNINYYLSIGFIFGLAFLSRYQTGLMLAGLGLWMLFIERQTLKIIMFMVIGGVIALFIGFLCDWWLYNEPVFTTWNYFSVNLLEGRVETFTHEPWWYYMYYSAVQILPPITLVLPLLVLFFWISFYKHPVTWITIPFVLFHHYLGHKEMRFLFPVLPFVPFIFAMAAGKIVNFNVVGKINIPKGIWRFLFFIVLLINTALLFLAMFLPASKETVMWEKCLSEINQNPTSEVVTYDAGELDMHFYNTTGLKIIPVSRTDSLGDVFNKTSLDKFYFASRKNKDLKLFEDSNMQYTMVCQIVPDWLMLLNFNNWTSRASLWRLWEIESK